MISSACPTLPALWWTPDQGVMKVDRAEMGEVRRELTMETSRLEHAILQAVIEYLGEHPLSREQVVMALINVSGYWQKKAVLSKVQKRLRDRQ